MYSRELLDHFQNPRNVGELPPPAITIEVSNPACGDVLVLSAAADLTEVRYRARGCTASLAAGSALTALLAGQPVSRLSDLSTSEIDEALGGLPAESKHAAVLAVDAARALASRLK